MTYDHLPSQIEMSSYRIETETSDMSATPAGTDPSYDPTFETKNFDLYDVDRVIDRVVDVVREYQDGHYEAPKRLVLGEETAKYVYIGVLVTQERGHSGAPLYVDDDGEINVYDIPVTIVETPMIEAVGHSMNEVRRRI